jgi:phenylacetate-CoA ligase
MLDVAKGRARRHQRPPRADRYPAVGADGDEVMSIFSTAYQNLVGRGLLPFYETRLRGRSTFRYRDEFEASQWLPPSEIEALQWGRFQALIGHAYETVPYYRRVFDERSLRPADITGMEDLLRLPVLDKSIIRAHQDDFLSSAYDRKALIRSATGGTTGDPMPFYFDRTSYERRHAAAMRGDSWAGWRLCGGEFYIWGVPLIPLAGWTRYKKLLHHAGLRRTVVNGFVMTSDEIRSGVEQYNRLRPSVVVGYTNAIYEFARYVKSLGLSMHQPRGVITSAEKLYAHQRSLIEEVFRAPVFDRYGCREVMMVGAECEQHSGMHATADNLLVEIVRNGRHCEPGETGEVLLTDLHNYGMPLIRYKPGDAASWKGRDCACGRGLPLLDVVEGRVLDVISTPSGKMVPGEAIVFMFTQLSRVSQYQVIQERREELTIRMVVDSPFTEPEQRLFTELCERAFGREMRVRVECGPEVVIERGRKFRPVLSKVPAGFDTTVVA